LIASDLLRLIIRCTKPVGNSVRDLLPIVLTVTVFQIFVFRQPLQNAVELLSGLGLVVAGLTLFVVGLEIGLFPLGEQMAHDFARKGSVPWLIAFAFALGSGTTFAEPALIAVADKAAEIAVSNAEAGRMDALRETYALTLRITVAAAVGVALVTGVLRILMGWPLHYLIMAGYVLVMVLTPFAPRQIIAIAYDSGGVTTSTITVPLTAALGVGLATCIKGRNPLIDGFGLIALASLTPIIFVLILGMIRS
jgi:hypothetical protein